MPRRGKGRWQIIRGKDQRVFRGKGKEVKKFNIQDMMAQAAKRGRQAREQAGEQSVAQR